MPALWLHSLAGLVITLVGSLIGRILLYLGVGAVNYTGLSIVFDTLYGVISGFISAGGGGFTGPAVQMMGFFHLGDCAQMLISAAFTRMIVQGASPNGAIFRWHVKAPTGAAL